jgi:hypothetical protein
MIMRYSIKRECWNEKTFNGYEDAPYWYITFSFYEIGLNDKGEFWGINNSITDVNKHYFKDILNNIIEECKLKINLVDSK